MPLEIWILRFIHGCYPIGEGAHMYNLQTSSGLGERTRGQRPRTGIGFPSLRRRIQPSKGIFRSGSRFPEGFSTRVFCSSTTEGADKLASEASAGSSNQVDLFGESLVGNLLDVLKLSGSEAKAMEETIAFAWDIGIWDSIFEGDSQVVVNVLIRNSVPPVQIANNISGSLSQIH
ncbi:hypothetical protein SO802_031342 [Lithocarpus litseifolius]|uniref:RNase H type-1 domain-containing protein n=1 Tax=Lithocarpus litseifolius TaxID=425828 RepID=A0AAW2BKB8_9ROSI